MEKTVRCKFLCTEVSKVKSFNAENPFYYRAKFQPVYGDSPENKKFFASTPSGRLEFDSIVEDAFEPGKEYYIDILAASVEGVCA